MTKPHAFLFPGQGSQSVGMLSGYLKDHAQIQETFEEASTALGYDLWKITQENAELLNQTQYTQPALLTGSVALWRIWNKLALPKPALLAGHSLGEYSALAIADVWTLSDAVRLVAKRGELMQQAVPQGVGAMAAILNLSDEAVREVCEKISTPSACVEVANYNSPGQVVISGHLSAVREAMSLAKLAGARKTIELPVSVPAHSFLMKPAAKELGDFMDTLVWNPPKIPVIHNVSVKRSTTQADIKHALIDQLSGTVRWVETILFLHQQGCGLFVECGPGQVLTGLNKRILPEVPGGSLQSLEGFNLLTQQG